MALFYPVVLLIFAMLIVGALLIYIVPEIVQVFEDTGGELPLLTQLMIGLSEFLRSKLWMLLIGIAVVWYGLRRLLARPEVRLRWDRHKLALPGAREDRARKQREPLCQYALHPDIKRRAPGRGNAHCR